MPTTRLVKVVMVGSLALFATALGVLGIAAYHRKAKVSR